MTRACVFGCAGATLTREEAAFFRDAKPWGFILFRRNIDHPDQVRRLTADLRAAVDNPGALILIDQEGGRVQRLGPPHWPSRPSARELARAGRDEEGRRALSRLASRLIAKDLRAVGVDANCAPVADLASPGGHDVIGDRAYGTDPRTVIIMARAAAEGLLAGGVLPVIKHIPGHGRADVDSHEALPVVRTPLSELEVTDFAPFRALSDMPVAMTAHVAYAAVDTDRPATRSRAVVSRIIRGAIGFQGLLISDDLSMKALGGDLTVRAHEALNAGCDLVLHCNGDLAEMALVVEGSRDLAGRAAARAEAALARRVRDPEPLDFAIAEGRFARWLDEARPS